MKISTPATSANLGPGFDTLGLALQLYNEVIISKCGITSVSINGEGSNNVRLKGKNIFIRIFNEIYFNLNKKKDNFRFVFNNNIPFSRGLGSSSSVIVSAVACAYYLSNFQVDKQLILNTALKYENHPDNIAPAVWGGFTSSIVHNGSVLSQKISLDEDLRAVMVIPNKSMSTNESRQMLPKSYIMSDVVSNLSHCAFLTACFCKKDYSNLRIASIDKMHEERRMHTFPELFAVRKIAYNNGALMSNLSGSGSSFFNLAHKSDAQNLKKVLQSNFTDFRVEIFEFDNNGFVIKE